MTGRRVIFVNRFFWPDHSATAQILADLAFDLAAKGWHVEVIASRLRYDDPGATPLPSRAVVRNVTIHRVATTRFGRDRLIGRALDYLSFYLTAFVAALLALRTGTILVVKTDPPVLQAPMAIAARLRRARQVNWLQDIYPELAAELGVELARGPIGRAIGWLRDATLRTSYRTVVIGRRMGERVRAAGVTPDQITIIHNWTDETTIVPLAATDNPLRREWGFGEDELVVGYSGNLGRAHELDTMLAAAERLKSEARPVRFLFIGGGHLRATLAAERDRRGLTAVVTRPYQPIESLPLSMSVADIQWLSLQPALEGLIVPSKFYSAAASGRPILFIGDPDGEIARLIADADCGWTVAPGDTDRLVSVLGGVTPAHLAHLGANARELVAGRLSRRGALESWESLLAEVAT